MSDDNPLTPALVALAKRIAASADNDGPGYYGCSGCGALVDMAVGCEHWAEFTRVLMGPPEPDPED